MWGISLLAEELLDSQEGLHFIKLVSWLVSLSVIYLVRDTGFSSRPKH